jgi:hypothetical protein
MKRLWICALCLTGFLAAGLPLHAQTAPSPQPSAPAATSAADAAFLATLQSPQASPAPAVPGVPAPSWTSCTSFQCRSNCVCGRGCISICTNLTLCTCGCMRDPNKPGGDCQV